MYSLRRSSLTGFERREYLEQGGMGVVWRFLRVDWPGSGIPVSSASTMRASWKMGLRSLSPATGRAGAGI